MGSIAARINYSWIAMVVVLHLGNGLGLSSGSRPACRRTGCMLAQLVQPVSCLPCVLSRSQCICAVITILLVNMHLDLSSGSRPWCWQLMAGSSLERFESSCGSFASVYVSARFCTHPFHAILYVRFRIPSVLIVVCCWLTFGENTYKMKLRRAHVFKVQCCAACAL